jgi:HSP20 family protein
MKLMRTWDRHGWFEPFYGLTEWPEPMLTRIPKPMRVEEFTEDGEFVVRAELAGLDPEKDVHVDVVDGALRIQAERRQETKVDEKDYFRTEIRYGTFDRLVPLPPGATEDDVKATYKDGILEVRVPLAAELPPAGARKVPIVHA